MLLTYSGAFYDLKKKLQPLYDEREAEAMAHEVLYFITGHNKTERLVRKETHFTELQQDKYDRALAGLLTGMPLQYVTGCAWFMEKEYIVNASVLIPRPETEELVQWVVDDWKSRNEVIDILDIGTGSGCIPISLRAALIPAAITSCDISNAALEVAKQNAEKMQCVIDFRRIDFLDTAQRDTLGKYDIVISNPPYIPVSEKARLHTNVKDHEPDIALFVPDNDALLFYKAIALFGKEHLNSSGYIYCELDSAHAAACKSLFEDEGYKNVEIRKDIHGNQRMLRAAIEILESFIILH